MLQISAAPLPVLNEGEDLEENEDLAINIVDEHSSWTVVKKKNKNKKHSDTVKWTKQQKKKFKQFGDPWYQEPYKYYHAATHDTPVAFPLQPQQQQQQPVLQQQPVVQPQPLLPLPQQPIVLPPQLPVGQLIQPAQCNRSQLLQWPSLKLSSLRRRRIAHQRCKSAGCQPFQKKMRLLRPDVQRLRTQTLL
jgi:hypothetical protein